MKTVSMVLLLSCSFAWILAAMPPAGAQAQEKTAPKAKMSRGEYLVTTSGCNDCHSPKVFTPKGPIPDAARLLSGHPADEKLPEIPAKLFGPDKWGGLTNNNLTAWAGPWGVSFAYNLTPDKETGMGYWTADDFREVLRSGKHLGGGRDILPPMPWFNLAAMSDEDLNAMFNYLMSLRPIRNEVPAPLPPGGK